MSEEKLTVAELLARRQKEGAPSEHRGAAVDAALKKAVCPFRNSPAQSLV